MVGAGWLLAGPPGVIVAAVLAALACLSLYRCAASHVLQLAGAHAITRDSEPDLYRLVDHLAEQAGTAPQLYWLPGDGANTLATGGGRPQPAISLTPGTLALLDHDELASLLARELSCLRCGDTLLSDISSMLAGEIMIWGGAGRRRFSVGLSLDKKAATFGTLEQVSWPGATWRMSLAVSAAGLIRTRPVPKHRFMRQMQRAPAWSTTRCRSCADWPSCRMQTARVRPIWSTQGWRSELRCGPVH